MPTVEAAGRKIYYERYDSPAGRDATPLVLVMGMGGSCRGWLPLQVPELSKARPVVIFDNRGVGESDDPGGAFTTADLADDTVALLDALELPRADVLGVFMGGMTAQELALRHAGRVGRLVLVGTYAKPDAKRRILLEEWAAQALERSSLGGMMRQRLVWTLQDETLEQEDLLEAMTSFFRDEDIPLSADLFARQCRACIQHDTLDRLPRIEHDCLILCGRNDMLTPAHFHRTLADGIPNSRLVTMQYGAHLIMMESAERFNQIVGQFLVED